MAGIRVGFGQPQAPRNVEQITKVASEYEYDAAYPLRYWLRTAAALIKEAKIYQQDGDNETTYFLLFRYAHLILANLSSHPSVREAEYRAAWKEANATVQEVLQVLDKMKTKVNERYTRYQELMRAREARAEESRRTSEATTSHLERQFERERARHVDAHEHKEFAIRLAQKDHKRRAAEPPPATVSEPEDMQKRLQSIRARVESQEPVSAFSRPPQGARQGPGYNYPTVPSSRIRYQDAGSSTSEAYNDHDHIDVARSPPTLPPKPHLSGIQDHTKPARPDKIPVLTSEPPTRVETPTDDRMFRASASLENGTALRTIFLPSTLRTTFLRIAQKNTLQNLETCGLLVGTLMKNAYFVSKLVIPSQTATSDTCEMTDEATLVEYVDSLDLMIVGWIHTHPSQTCFMSSQDLHTHLGYQASLAESVAIVCAPSKGDVSHGGDYGVFRLTDPPGKKVIFNCQKPGVFHPHEVDNLYTDAIRPGHVVEAPEMPFDIVDLR